jgi:diacylglycerol kinase
MKLIKSFIYAWSGIKTSFKSEANFKIHMVAATVAIALGVLLNLSNTEWCAIILCIAFVLSIEMMNTAIEKLCDVVHKDTHPVIKMVKDIAAGAVLVAAVSSLIIGTIIFLPKIIMHLKLFYN